MTFATAIMATGTRTHVIAIVARCTFSSEHRLSRVVQTLIGLALLSVLGRGSVKTPDPGAGSLATTAQRNLQLHRGA